MPQVEVPSKIDAENEGRSAQDRVAGFIESATVPEWAQELAPAVGEALVALEVVLNILESRQLKTRIVSEMRLLQRAAEHSATAFVHLNIDNKDITPQEIELLEEAALQLLRLNVASNDLQHEVSVVLYPADYNQAQQQEKPVQREQLTSPEELINQAETMAELVAAVEKLAAQEHVFNYESAGVQKQIDAQHLLQILTGQAAGGQPTFYGELMAGNGAEAYRKYFTAVNRAASGNLVTGSMMIPSAIREKVTDIMKRYEPQYKLKEELKDVDELDTLVQKFGQIAGVYGSITIAGPRLAEDTFNLIKTRQKLSDFAKNVNTSPGLSLSDVYGMATSIDDPTAHDSTTGVLHEALIRVLNLEKERAAYDKNSANSLLTEIRALQNLQKPTDTDVSKLALALNKLFDLQFEWKDIRSGEWTDLNTMTILLKQMRDILSTDATDRFDIAKNIADRLPTFPPSTDEYAVTTGRDISNDIDLKPVLRRYIESKQPNFAQKAAKMFGFGK